MTGDRNPSRFSWVLELPMTPALIYLPPAVLMDQPEDIPRLHVLNKVYRD